MKTICFENLKKIIDDGKLADIDKAYCTGYIEAMDALAAAMIPNDSTIKNELCELLSRLSMAKSCGFYKVGDQIEVNLDGFGVFTATAQKVTEDSVIFMFDDCIAVMPMNNMQTNEGGYEKSGLCYWVNNVLRKAFPEEIGQKITNISIPTYGMIFGHDEFYDEYLESDKDEQFELMRKRKNRIADYKNQMEWYWLKNATKKSVSAASFATVTYPGYANYYHAAHSTGVRPVFTLSV